MWIGTEGHGEDDFFLNGFTLDGLGEEQVMNFQCPAFLANGKFDRIASSICGVNALQPHVGEEMAAEDLLSGSAMLLENRPEPMSTDRMLLLGEEAGSPAQKAYGLKCPGGIWGGAIGIVSTVRLQR